MIATTNRSGCRSRRSSPIPQTCAATELAEAERADARRATSPAQITGLAAAHQKRRAEDRVARWRTTTEH